MSSILYGFIGYVIANLVVPLFGDLSLGFLDKYLRSRGALFTVRNDKYSSQTYTMIYFVAGDPYTIDYHGKKVRKLSFSERIAHVFFRLAWYMTGRKHTYLREDGRFDSSI